MIRLCFQIFGGYGGQGHRRQYFNDMYILDLESNTWLGEEQGLSVDREGGLKCVSHRRYLDSLPDESNQISILYVPTSDEFFASGGHSTIATWKP